MTKSDTNTIRLLNAATVNGYSIVTYQRPLRASDQYDRPILTNRSQAIIWAVGPLNQRKEVSFHTSYLKKNALIDFGRPARWNCPMPETDQPPMTSVQIPSRSVTAEQKDSDEYETPLEVTTKRTNGRRRGGNNRGTSRPQEDSYEDSEKSASRNKEQSQGVPPPTPVKKREAWEIPPIQCYEPEDGVFYAQMGPTAKDGSPVPTGTGRLCHWTQTGDLEADDFQSFGAYQRTLELKCDQGEPGVIQWTPDSNTPDTVYYQLQNL
ncbi:unnamed protein product [Phaedon cochleariae]|uniref:DOMON domain-containing protein n=1 Tax=Phaedon cochleariae TaxID=80249 RepID=A0A9N9X3Z8_PHACE|nr:unnamed protein product [Phaedon cochleariae]